MSLDESTDTRKELLLGDAEALCTTGETGDLEKSQQRRGRIFYVSSQNTLFTVFLNWLQSSLDVINFFSPEILEPFVLRQICHLAQKFSWGLFLSSFFLVSVVTSAILVLLTQAASV